MKRLTLIAHVGAFVLLLAMGCQARGALEEKQDTVVNPVPDTALDTAPDLSGADLNLPNFDLATDQPHLFPDSPTDLPAGTEYTVKAVQNPTPKRECNEIDQEQPLTFGSVTLKGVVVTGKPHAVNNSIFRFYVADKSGGKYSGIAVIIDKTYLESAFPNNGLNVGDELTIIGELQEFYCFTRVKVATGGVTLTTKELGAPKPVVISSCAELQDEALEGVYVEIQDVKIVDNAKSHGEIEIEDFTGARCIIDDDFALWTNNSEGATQTDPNKPGVTATEYLSIAGVVHYTFGDFKLEPTSLADIKPKSVIDDQQTPADVSDTELLDSNPPDTSLPDTSVPDTSVPDTNLPDTSVADVQPDSSVKDVPTLPTSTICISEIHYDNKSDDVNEGIEILAPAGTDLDGWSLVFYNGADGKLYLTKPLTGIVPNLGNGWGVLWFAIVGVQNGTKDSVALVNPLDQVIQFLSWEGVMTAPSGAAAGMTSVDIGVKETENANIGESLQITGGGTNCSDFTWVGPLTATEGTMNDNLSPTPLASDIPVQQNDANNGD